MKRCATLWEGGDTEHAFATAWRNQAKWVVSRSLQSVGPNAASPGDGIPNENRKLKAGRDGEIEVAGPDPAKSLAGLGLIDEQRIYLRPVVLGQGKPHISPDPGRHGASSPMTGLTRK